MKIGKYDINVDKEIKQPKQYSKVWMTRWQCFCMFWISVYMIADIYYNQSVNANNVIILLVSSIIGCVIPYFAKSFLETKEDKKMQLEKLKYKITNPGNSYSNSIINNYETSDGLENNEEVG